VVNKNLLMEFGFRQLDPMPMNLPSTLPRILYSMKGLNTLRLTVILSKILNEEGGYVPVHTVFKAVG